MSDQLKAAVTVAEMARMVGLSRARFYQLQKAGVFPAPKKNPSTERPFYDQELQEVCLEVRRKHCGVNGKVVLFYSRRRQEIASTRGRPKKEKVKEPHTELVEALRSLGLTATPAQVDEVVKELFGGRTDGDQGEVIRAIFLHLKKRKNPSDKVG